MVTFANKAQAEREPANFNKFSMLQHLAKCMPRCEGRADGHYV